MPSRITLARLAGVTCLGISLAFGAAASSAACGGDDVKNDDEDLLEAGPDEGIAKRDGGPDSGEDLPEGVVETPADENNTQPVNIGFPVQPDGGRGGVNERTCFEKPRAGCPNFPPGGGGSSADGGPGGSGLIITVGEEDGGLGDGGEPDYPPLEDPPDNPDPDEDEYEPSDVNSVICDGAEDGEPGCPAIVDEVSGCDSDIKTPEQCTDKKPPTCGKRIFVDLQVYGAIDPVLRTNGCWIPYAPRLDKSFRKCEYPAKFSNLTAPRWFYNYVSPEHELTVDKNSVDSCAKDAADGYEFFSRDDTKWRFVNHVNASAYFGRAFSDDTRMDDYWKSYVALRKRTVGANHLFPMINVGVPYARYSTRKVQREVFRICKRLPNYAHLGLYSNQNYALNADARQRRIVQALNACTRPNKK